MEQLLKENRIKQYFDDSKTFQSRLNASRTRIVNRFLQDTEIARVLPKIESTPENAIRILEENGIKGVKIFCIHSSRKKTFTVRSNKWDWEIKPLNARSKEKIPDEILRRVKLLQNAGIQIKKLYIGKPVAYSIREICKSEIQDQRKILSDEIGYITIKVLAGIEQANKALKEAERRATSVTFLIGEYLRDPILIISLPCYKELIEVGRWV